MPQALQGARILVVEDVSVNRRMMEKALRDAGAETVISVASAEEALPILLGNTTNPGVEIDLVLLDVMLPGMDGLDFVRLIREHERLRDIPVIMVTAKNAAEDLQAGFEAGATDYIAKPVRRAELEARARSALALRRERQLRQRREQELREATAALEKANLALLALSNTDPLTGLANRRRLDEFLRDEFLRSQRDGQPISFIMADIDHFKAYNDFYGHPQGDFVLQQVARVMARSLRRATDLAARYGGEELAGVLAQTPLAGARTVAERVRRGVAALGIQHKGSLTAPVVTVSIGVASTEGQPNLTADDLINLADHALYRAKGGGRNRVEIYEPTSVAARSSP